MGSSTFCTCLGLRASRLNSLAQSLLRTSMWSSSCFRLCPPCFCWPTGTFPWRSRYWVRLSSISFAFTHSWPLPACPWRFSLPPSGSWWRIRFALCSRESFSGDPITRKKEMRMSSKPMRSEITEPQVTSIQTETGEASVRNSVLDDQIRRRAYEIYLERGEQPGRDLEDWFQAERELEGGRFRARKRGRKKIRD